MEIAIAIICHVASAACFFISGWHIHKATCKPQLRIMQTVTLPEGMTEEERQEVVRKLAEGLRAEVTEWEEGER